MTTGFPGAVGHTPLIRLRALSERTGCNVLAKAEFMNPGAFCSTESTVLSAAVSVTDSDSQRPGSREADASTVCSVQVGA